MIKQTLREKKFALERDELLHALVTTDTQIEAATSLGITPSGIGVMIGRHPGIRDEARALQAKALADWSKLERAKVKA